MLIRLRMLKLSVGKGRQVIKQLCCRVLRYSGYRARGVCALQSSSYLCDNIMSQTPPSRVGSGHETTCSSRGKSYQLLVKVINAESIPQ